MSLDTKQILHIVTELIVIVGISIYFVNKNKQLSDHIEELELKIKQQEEILQNHDTLILKIMNTVNVMNSQPQFVQQHVQQQHVQPQLKTKLPKNINSSKKVVMIIPPQQSPPQKQPLRKVEEIIEEEEEEEENEFDDHNEEEDLDDELLEELKDLEEEDI
jgi:hypothetical protein